MNKKKKIMNLCFCMIPAIVAILIIILNLAIIFNEESGILYKNYNWAVFWIFMGLALISHTIISIVELCKRE